MFGSYSRTIVPDCDLEICRVLGKCDLDGTVLWSETQRVIDQVAHGALEQRGIGRNLSLSAAIDRDMTVLRDCFIKRGNFLDCSACIELLPRDRLACSISSCNEKQV